MTDKMPRKLKNQDALAKRRLQQKLCNRRRYNTMKNDPEMLEIEKMKRRQRYLQKKEARKEKSSHAQREQRKKWRENSKRYRQRKKEEAVEEEKLTPFETIHVQALPDLDHSEAEEPDIKLDNPLPLCPQIQAEVMKVRYAELRKRKNLLRIIATLRERDKSQRKYIQKLERKLIQMRAMFSPYEPRLDGDNSGNSGNGASEERESPIIMENVIKFYSEDTNSVKRTGKKKITRNEEQKRVTTKKKPQRGWVFVGPVKDKPIKKNIFVMDKPVKKNTADVKKEPEWETDSDVSQQVKQELTGDSEEAGLQMDIEIKQEIEVGPVQLQPQDIYYSNKNNKEIIKKQ